MSKTRFCRLLRCACSALFSIVVIYAHPAFSADALDYRITEYKQATIVDDSGLATTHVTLSLLLASDAALQRFSRYPISYNSDLQALTITMARTVHTDGESVAADLKDAVFDRPAPATAVAPMFSSEHLRFVAFPAVRRGDTIQLSYTLADRATLLPGKFADRAYFPLTDVFDDAQVTLDTPAGMPIQIDVKGVQVASDSVQGTRHVRVYRYRTPAGGPVHEQAESVSPLDSSPYVVATNVADYAELGQIYAQGAQPQMLPSESVRKLTDQITQHVTDRRQQATLIYNWVSQNIRYLAVWVGSGPVVPHSADQVLHDGYGDCKDHDALFNAMLSVKGIRADSVLVNLGNSYRLSSAPTLAVFNHAITWLPEFGVFADTTSGFAPFGVLTFLSSDKPALDTVTGQILHTPPQTGENSASTSNYTIHVNNDGDADVHGSLLMNGQATITPRLWLSRYKTDRIGYELLKKTGLTGALHIAAPEHDALDQSIELDLTGTIDNLALMPGPAALAINTMPAYSSIKTFADYVLTRGGQPLDGPCAGTTVREHYIVALPASAQIIAIPPNVESNNGTIVYTARYHQAGQMVEIDRALQRNLKTNVCSGATLKQWHATALDISNDLKRQILYR
jgi:hypothetical protein